MSRGRGNISAVPDEFKRTPKPEVHSFRDLMAQSLPPVKWIVPGMLPEGVTLLAGKAKVRKSWFALGLCIAVAAGGVALGKIPVERGETLYAALEDNKRRLQSRGRKVLGSLAEAPEGFFYATAWPRLDEGGLEALAGWLDEHPDCRLVVLDTLAKVRPRPARGSSGGYQEDYEALEGLLPLAAERQIAIVVVTHTRKAAASDVLDEINATTGLMGGVDGFLVFKTERGKAEATMHVDGREIEEPGEHALRWDRELHGWQLVGDAEETRLTEQRRAILDTLRAAGEPLGPKAISDASGVAHGTVRVLLGKLAVDERVEGAGRGRWRLVQREDGLLTPAEVINTSVNSGNAHTQAEKSLSVNAVNGVNGGERTDSADEEEGRGAGSNAESINSINTINRSGESGISKGDMGVNGAVNTEPATVNKLQAVQCSHGYPAGRGCYTCDPEHPYRRRD